MGDPATEGIQGQTYGGTKQSVDKAHSGNGRLETCILQVKVSLKSQGHLKLRL